MRFAPYRRQAHTARMTRLADAGAQSVQRLSEVGPWFSKTRWGKTHGRLNGLIVLAILLFCLWKSFY